MNPCLWLLPTVGMIMLAITGAASAQSYPATRVRIITAAAGGGSDYAARLIAGPLGVAQTVPGYEAATRLAFFVPAGTPAPIITRLNQEIVRVLNRPDVQEKFHAFGIETVGDSPEALAALIKAEIVSTGKVIKEAGIRTE